MRLNHGTGLVVGLAVAAAGVTGWTLAHDGPVLNTKAAESTTQSVGQTRTDWNQNSPIPPGFLDCEPIIWDGWAPPSEPGSPQSWDEHLAAGWTGSPDDGIEALYPPGCEAARWTCPDEWEFQGATFTCELAWTN